MQNANLIKFIEKLQARVRGIICRSKLKNEFRVNKNLFGNYTSYKPVASSKIVN